MDILGQVFTRKVVADYMVKLLDLDHNKLILDPCCGAGAFLFSLREHGYKKVWGYEIDSALYEKVRYEFSDYNILCENFLTSTSGGFDGVIMNPPYIRHEEIDNLSDFGVSKNKIRKLNNFKYLPSNANMYMYFVIKALDVLSDCGKLVVIFPSSWLKSSIGKEFKKVIMSKAYITNCVHVSGEVFEKKPLVDVIILCMKKGGQKKWNDTICENIEVFDEKIRKRSGNKSFVYMKLPISFDTYASIRRGITTGYNPMFINPKLNGKNAYNYLAKIISTPKNVVGYSVEGAKYDELLLIDTSSLCGDVCRYLEEWKHTILNQKNPKTLYNKILLNNSSWYKLKLYDCSGIIFNYFVRKEMKFIENFSGKIVRDNFYIIKPREKINSYLLFALLNNYYTYYQLEICGKLYGAGLLKLQKYDFSKLSFFDIDKFTSADFDLLIYYAKKMIDTGESMCIDDITRILAKYTNINFDKIIYMYNSVRESRLLNGR